MWLLFLLLFAGPCPSVKRSNKAIMPGPCPPVREHPAGYYSWSTDCRQVLGSPGEIEWLVTIRLLLGTILVAAGCSAAMQKNNYRWCWSATQTSHGHGWLLVRAPVICGCWSATRTSHAHGRLLVSNGDGTCYRWVLVRHADKPWTSMVVGQQWRQHRLQVGAGPPCKQAMDTDGCWPAMGTAVI